MSDSARILWMCVVNQTGWIIAEGVLDASVMMRAVLLSAFHGR